jgi:hypothetical protein
LCAEPLGLEEEDWRPRRNRSGRVVRGSFRAVVTPGFGFSSNARRKGGLPSCGGIGGMVGNGNGPCLVGPAVCGLW